MSNFRKALEGVSEPIDCPVWSRAEGRPGDRTRQVGSGGLAQINDPLASNHYRNNGVEGEPVENSEASRSSPTTSGSRSATADLAAYATLIATPREWINRRVESPKFHSKGSTRRHVSADVTVPAEFASAGFLPSALLPKRGETERFHRFSPATHDD